MREKTGSSEYRRVVSEGRPTNPAARRAGHSQEEGRATSQTALRFSCGTSRHSDPTVLRRRSGIPVSSLCRAERAGETGAFSAFMSGKRRCALSVRLAAGKCGYASALSFGISLLFLEEETGDLPRFFLFRCIHGKMIRPFSVFSVKCRFLWRGYCIFGSLYDIILRRYKYMHYAICNGPSMGRRPIPRKPPGSGLAEDRMPHTGIQAIAELREGVFVLHGADLHHSHQ